MGWGGGGVVGGNGSELPPCSTKGKRMQKAPVPDLKIRSGAVPHWLISAKGGNRRKGEDISKPAPGGEDLAITVSQGDQN